MVNSSQPYTTPSRRASRILTPVPQNNDGELIIRKVFIANRGEIACRVIQTCRCLGVISVAVYATEDSLSNHVFDADEAICLGSMSRREGNPFLDSCLLVKTALDAGADAIHPGYGYLSESAEFATAVREAGLIFIGPSASAMSTLGDKRSSKAYLKKYAPEVPLIPGFDGTSQAIADLEAAAEKIGFPVMLKASAGGGGRGMRIAYKREQLQEELQRVQSEASRSFGSDDCILEKYIEAGKHIEIQVLGDSHGKVLALWERDCSVQRRHQKVIEETPSPWLSAEKREQMCGVAIRIAELLQYEGAGTVEFVFDVKTDNFYFLEVNTRLQVEHPITEEVTGLDIVSLQLYVAAGGSLNEVPALQNIPQSGHAIEVRLCAEDPRRQFLPEHGTIRLWRPRYPSKTEMGDVRFESAIRTGSTVSIFFDSMIAKIVVWAPTRLAAIAKLSQVLTHSACIGVRTNQQFLRNCLNHDAFHNPAYTTSFISDNLPQLLDNPTSSPGSNISSLLLVPLVFHRYIRRHQSSDSRPFRQVRASFRNQPYGRVGVDATIIEEIDSHEDTGSAVCLWNSPRSSASTRDEPCLISFPGAIKDGLATSSAAFRLTASYNNIRRLIVNGYSDTANLRYNVELISCTRDESQPHSLLSSSSASLDVVVGDQVITADIVFESTSRGTQGGQKFFCHFPALGTWVQYRCSDLLTYMDSLRDASSEGTSSQKLVKAPMPCKVLSIPKQQGEQVKAGEIVIVIESMKMEMAMSAPTSGKFNTVVKRGDFVDEGKALCWMD